MISIIVPVYNTKEYLTRCVESLIMQEYQDKEIILVDDGSSDESGSMCDEYGGKYDCVRVLHKENGGLMSAWMAGVEMSRGEYLCFVDSDDWVEKEMLEKMAEHLTGSCKEMVVCNHSIDRETGERTYIDNGLAPGAYDKRALKEEIFLQLLGNEVRPVCFSRCMKLISRELILQNMRFCDSRIRMGEDVNIILPALFDTERLVIMEKAYFYHYYYNQSSMVHKHDAGLYENVRLLSQIIKQVLSEKFKGSPRLSEMYRRADMEYIFLLMLVLKNESRGNKTGYRKNIRAVCTENRDLIRCTPVKVENKANRLLYLVMKHPGFLPIWALRMAMVIYYK